MSKSSVRSAIRLRGVRHNNLKNFDLDLPLNQLIVVTGLSGSGKSSLAFDTLFAEGQRRYIETFSPYARQFLDRMDKPQVDSIEGIPPAIAIEQRNSVRTTRSTVGTMTEICDYMKLLWPHVAQLHCRQCGRPVRKDPPQKIWEALLERGMGKAEGGVSVSSPLVRELLVTFEIALTDKLSLEESLALVAKQGYQRLLVNGQVLRLEEFASQAAGEMPGATRNAQRPQSLTVVQDRLKAAPAVRPRFMEACEQAYHFGKGKLTLYPISGAGVETASTLRFSNRLHCAQCDIEYREPSPALFSFNHPVGACPTCRGFGRIISIDYNLALPDRSKTLAEGVVKPWQSGQSADCQRDLLRMCRKSGVSTDVPFEKLSKKWQDFVTEGAPDYGRDEAHEWPRAWYGIKGYFRWLESKSYKMHVRVLLSRYRVYTPCPICAGMRFQPDALLYRANLPESNSSKSTHESANGTATSDGFAQGSFTLAQFYQLPIRRALELIERLESGTRSRPKHDPLSLVFTEVHSRLTYLDQVGLGYLTLDRPTRSLSGGETERVSLTTCLGTRLVNTLFVLDEPSVGLHPRDTERLIRVVEQLRDAGNTVVVVEHEASVMRAADQIVDLGPGHGATGGSVVFQGSFAEILKCQASLTGQYLSGRKQIQPPTRRPVLQLSGRYPRAIARSQPENAFALNDATAPAQFGADPTPFLKLTGATLHNLKDVSVQVPLSRLVCVTGVSGSGKTTLLREVLLPALAERLRSGLPWSKPSDRLNPEPSEPSETERDDSALRNPHSAVLHGTEHLARVVLVDQSILGKTPRSNPAVYIGAFDDMRELYAQSDLAKRRGLNASAFSFNSAQGQCERCRGAGFEKIEMQFLSDVFIRCPECDGKRYRSHILEIKISAGGQARGTTARASTALSIADLLDATIDEAIDFLASFPESRYARRAAESLKLLQETGLGYLKVGQPINTLSGGESQRLKLVKHLAESLATGESARERNTLQNRVRGATTSPQRLTLTPTLFLFDEPTTGLHFDDVRVLLKVFQRLVDSGHSVVVIEHNLDVIKSADWVIDLGPDAGDRGGRIVAEGTPEQVALCRESHTGQALRQSLGASRNQRPDNARASLSAARQTDR